MLSYSRHCLKYTVYSFGSNAWTLEFTFKMPWMTIDTRNKCDAMKKTENNSGEKHWLEIDSLRIYINHYYCVKPRGYYRDWRQNNGIYPISKRKYTIKTYCHDKFILEHNACRRYGFMVCLRLGSIHKWSGKTYKNKPFGNMIGPEFQSASLWIKL